MVCGLYASVLACGVHVCAVLCGKYVFCVHVWLQLCVLCLRCVTVGGLEQHVSVCMCVSMNTCGCMFHISVHVTMACALYLFWCLHVAPVYGCACNHWCVMVYVYMGLNVTVCLSAVPVWRLYVALWVCNSVCLLWDLCNSMFEVEVLSRFCGLFVMPTCVTVCLCNCEASVLFFWRLLCNMSV